MARRLFLSTTTAVVTTLGALGLPMTAMAQSANQSKSSALEEIVVTAERFSSTVQTTPVAVSAFSPALLEERQVTNVLEAARQIPGIVITPATANAGAARIVLRGAGQENSGILFDPAVGIYIDDVYQPRINGAFFDLFDIASLEVLRGPQGTLYGRNTSGGAIKISTKKPSHTLTYGGDIALGNFNRQDVRLYLSGPLVQDTLAASVSVVKRKRDGFIYSPGNGRDMNNRDSSTFRGKLLWTPTARFSAELSADYISDNSDPGLGVPLQVGVGVNDPFAIGRNRDYTRTELSGPSDSKLTSRGGSLRMSYDVSDTLQINSITGYRQMKQILLNPLWLTAAAVNTGDGARNFLTSSQLSDEFYSQEVNVTLTTERFKGVAGVFYSHEEGNQNYDPVYNSTPRVIDRETTAYSVFAQGTYTLFGGLGLTAGIRANREEADLTQFYYTLTARPQSNSAEFKGTTPKIGLNWQVNSNLLGYVSYTKGFKSGGINVVPPNANTGVPGRIGAPIPYDAEEIDSYEAGFKFQTSDRRFRLNFAVFEARYDGLQLPVFFPGTSTSYTSNASSAKIQGIEIEPTWQVLDALQLYGVMSFSGGEYTSAFTCSNENGRFEECSNRDIKGLIPEQATLGFNFEPQLPIPGSIRVNGQWSYTSRYFNNTANGGPLVETPDVGLYDASIAWTSPDEHWTVSLEGRNLADEQYSLAGLQLSSAAIPSVTGYAGEPRTYALRIRGNFSGADRAVAPPPPPPPPAPPAPPPPPPAEVAYEAREFVVYFPFDQYVLTPEAQQVISQAADYAKGGNATRVVVVGHADTSGSAAYNVRLSERRAKATADALVGSGLAQTALAVDWKGESQPAVATGDGVKEPLNRRATININF